MRHSSVMASAARAVATPCAAANTTVQRVAAKPAASIEEGVGCCSGIRRYKTRLGHASSARPILVDHTARYTRIKKKEPEEGR